MMKTFVAAFLAGLLFSEGVSARGDVPGRPEGGGILNAVDLAARTITLDGKTYALTNQTRWVGLGPGETPGSVASKLLNHRVGFQLQDEGGSKPEVTQIWVLP